jgi:hypothetical protein
MEAQAVLELAQQFKITGEVFVALKSESAVIALYPHMIANILSQWSWYPNHNLLSPAESMPAARVQ